MLGVDTDAPGFGSVRIAPHLGDLTWAVGVIPHPKGAIRVDYRKKGTKLVAKITLPEGVNGTYCWQGKTTNLTPGENVLK